MNNIKAQATKAKIATIDFVKKNKKIIIGVGAGVLAGAGAVLLDNMNKNNLKEEEQSEREAQFYDKGLGEGLAIGHWNGLAQAGRDEQISDEYRIDTMNSLVNETREDYAHADEILEGYNQTIRYIENKMRKPE